MTNFVRAANPIWWIPDLVGQPLNDEYYAFFRQNTTPFALQNVFQDPDGTIPWANPLQFQPAGTLPNNLYFDETLVYRIEIRHGSNPTDQLIYEIDNFVPGITLTPGNTALLTADNMITNPQFADVYFYPQSGSSNPSFTFAPGSSGNYTIELGPGWRLDLEGSGTITVEQFAISGQADSSDGIVGNPTYFIDISNTGGWTGVKLVQRFSNNGAIFANGAVAIAFSAAATTTAQDVEVNYVPSTGTPTPIFNRLIATGNLTAYANLVNIPASSNTDLDDSAFVDIVFTLPVGSHLSFTNIQLTGQSVPLPSPTPVAPIYQEKTYERIVDQEFNVYKPALFNKRIPSRLVAWDFPLNPAQFIGSTVPPQATGINSSYYAWDQTILFQSANSGISVSSPNSGALTLTAAVTTQMALIQYLDTFETRDLLSDRIAVNIAAISNTVSNLGIGCTVSLWYTKDATLPSAKLPVTSGSSPTSNSLVATLDANGKPATFNGNWFEVPRAKQQEDASFVVIPTGNAEFNDYNFHGWDLGGIADVNNATFFAIVIGTASITSGDSITFQSVGMMNGDLATRPGHQSADEVLRECRYFYEKSYELGTPRGSAVVNGVINTIAPLIFPGTNVALNTRSFLYSFKVSKRTVDIAGNKFSLTFWDGNGVAGQGILIIHDCTDNSTPAVRVIGISTNPALSSYYFTNPPPTGALGGYITQDGFFAAGKTISTDITVARTSGIEGILSFHYEADCRLGR